MTIGARPGLRAPRPEQIDVPDFEIDAADTVVDIGCGDGAACVYAGGRGAEVIGIDVDPDAMALAEAAMRDVPARSWRGIVSDCNPIPLPDGCATVVIATEVLEHVEEPNRLVGELSRIGRPGARYLIAVPDPASESLMEIVAPPWYWKKPYHQRVYDHSTLEALITGAGLTIDGRYRVGFYHTMWWTLRMALGARPYEPTPESPILRGWEAAWSSLASTPHGPSVARALDDLIPKSQVVVAHKVGSPSSFGGPSWSKDRWRRRLRNGSLRLGGFDLSWSLRRARRTT